MCVAALITDLEDRILLVKSAKPGRSWELPGGRLRAETIEDGARREVLEETGLTMKVIDSLPPTVYEGEPKPGARYASLVVVVRGTAQGEPTADSDAIAVGWFRSDSLPRLSDLASSRMLRSWVDQHAAMHARTHTEVTTREMAAAILSFCDRADDLADPDPATRAAFTTLLTLGNRLRPAGKLCGHQNEDYPEFRCTRRARHKGRHSKHGSGASW